MKLTQDWCSIHSCILLLIILVQVHLTQSRTVHHTQNSNNHVITKRNVWWSKKSTDSVNQIDKAHQKAFDHIDLKNMDNEVIKEVFGCYTDDCVPGFVWCGHEALDMDSYEDCKLQHRLCAATCFLGAK